jgi:hypothetical protein
MGRGGAEKLEKAWKISYNEKNKILTDFRRKIENM